MMKHLLAALTTTSLIALPSLAHEDTVRHAAAHTHGKGDAFLALTGDELIFDLAAPKANFVLANGEGSTIDEDDLPAVSDLFTVPASAGCELDEMVMEEFQAGAGSYDSESNDHEHGDHEHDDHEQHESHDHSGHSDLMISVVMTCDKPKAIDHITLNLFETYGGFEEVNLVFAVEDEMLATTLKKGQSKVKRP